MSDTCVLGSSYTLLLVFDLDSECQLEDRADHLPLCVQHAKDLLTAAASQSNPSVRVQRACATLLSRGLSAVPAGLHANDSKCRLTVVPHIRIPGTRGEIHIECLKLSLETPDPFGLKFDGSCLVVTDVTEIAKQPDFSGPSRSASAKPRSSVRPRSLADANDVSALKERDKKLQERLKASVSAANIQVACKLRSLFMMSNRTILNFLAFVTPYLLLCRSGRTFSVISHLRTCQPLRATSSESGSSCFRPFCVVEGSRFPRSQGWC
jgi:hypothetical protein